MAFWTDRVDVCDVDTLMRDVYYPADLNDPMRQLIFPHADDSNEEHKDTEINWLIAGFRRTVETDEESYYKACAPDDTPVGMLGWKIIYTPALLTMDGETLLRAHMGTNGVNGTNRVNGANGMNGLNGFNRANTDHNAELAHRRAMDDTPTPEGMCWDGWRAIGRRVREDMARAFKAENYPIWCEYLRVDFEQLRF
ncbi:hypothetical protein BDW62DRAFT_199129 [Aspergillus aurantiobrunneus]